MVKITQEKEYDISMKNAIMFFDIGRYVYATGLLLLMAIENLTVACFFLMLFYFNEWQWIKGSEVFGMWLFITLGRVSFYIIRGYIQRIKEEYQED